MARSWQAQSSICVRAWQRHPEHRGRSVSLTAFAMAPKRKQESNRDSDSGSAGHEGPSKKGKSSQDKGCSAKRWRELHAGDVEKGPVIYWCAPRTLRGRNRSTRLRVRTCPAECGMQDVPGPACA